jgi:hypothetical protein
MLPLLSDEDVPRSITDGLGQHFPELGTLARAGDPGDLDGQIVFLE